MFSFAPQSIPHLLTFNKDDFKRYPACGRSSYSCLNAVIGSIFAARRAGIQHAIIATTAISNGTPAKVSGSAALTPYSRFFIN
jgi:hypothetical protein